VVVAADALGVPEICPVSELNESPTESVGVIVQDVAGDPVFTGETIEIAEFLTKLNVVTLNEISGIDSTTASVRIVGDEPAELVAVTV
jgi:hypothetical protein